MERNGASPQGLPNRSEKQNKEGTPSPPGDGGDLLHASPSYSGCTPAEPYPPGREEASSSFNQDAVILSSFSAFNINSALMDRSFSFAPHIKAMLTRLLIFLTKPPVEVNMNS